MIPLSTFIELLCTALSIAIIAVVYSCIVTLPGEILHPLRVLIKKVLLPRTTYIENHQSEMGEELIEPNQVIVIPKIWQAGGKTFTSYMELTDYRKIYNMVIGCEKCVAGQIALWSYILYIIFMGVTYQFHIHIMTISFSILATKLLSIAYSFIQRRYE